MKSNYKSVITIDVEDGISIAMRDAFSVESEQTDRVLSLTEQILDLLAEMEVKGTFFILGQVAEKFPSLIKDIAKSGHEVGVHGYNHLQFFKMTPEQAYDELSSAKKLIEDLTGNRVYGHRAPAFSITPDTKWGLDVIARAGFVYDSSIMPTKMRRYGWPGFPKSITTIQTSTGYELIEVPLSTVSILGKELPVCGGGYLRLFPEKFTNVSMKKILKDRHAIIYIHPYELDTTPYPDYYFEQLNKSGFLKRNIMKSMWINRKAVYSRLLSLLNDFKFDKMINLVDNYRCEKSEFPLQIEKIKINI